MTKRTVALRVVRMLIIAGLVLVVLVAAALLLLQTRWAHDSLRDLAVRRASSFLRADVRIGSLGGSLLTGAMIDDVVIERDGEPIVTVGRIAIDYRVMELVRGRLDFPRIVVDRPVVHARKIGSLFPDRDQSKTAQAPAFTIDRLVVNDGRIVIGPEPEEVAGFRVPDIISNLDARLQVHRDAERTAVAVEQLSFVGESPLVTLRALSGSVSLAGGDLVLEDIEVQLAESSFAFGGTVENFRNLGEGDGKDQHVDRVSHPGKPAGTH